ncbi:MAG: T9SS type A sorting domain-containing protein [Chlorobi bacterium]|nr:T9SS type A sorting domain-containing protein [Chlorobiota bacterium]
MKLKNSFSLFTPFLSDEQLSENELNSNDVLLASDHLPVVADFEFVNVTKVDEENDSKVGSFNLHQNYPNPFSKESGGNPTTTIEYSVPSLETQNPEKPGHVFSSQTVTLKIYDLLGKEIATLVDEKKAPGNYSARFDAKGLSSGNYIYALNVGGKIVSKKMTLIR